MADPSPSPMLDEPQVDPRRSRKSARSAPGRASGAAGGAAVAFRPLILLPTYDNAAKITPVLDAVAKLGHPLLVVNDGSRDGTAELLSRWGQAHPEIELDVISYADNRGKGAALRLGFARAEQMGFTHALTIDTDGQHDAADAPALLAEARGHPKALVSGCRDAVAPDYPEPSRLGRVLSNLSIYMSSGRRIEDSQCGYRVYPIGLVGTVRCWAGRYGYEAELLTRSAWAGCALIQVPIRVIYPPRGERISHFRPVKDSIHGYVLHFVLSLRAVTPWRFVKWPGPSPDDPPRPPWWRRLLEWLDPRELIAQVRRDRISQMSVAAGLGIGVFVANLPVYPFQTLVAMYFAKRLHLHPVSTVLGSQLAFPPIGVGLIFAGIYVGHLLLTGQPPSFDDFAELGSLGFSELQALMHEYFFSWWIGGTLMGLALGWVTFLLALLALKFVPVKHRAMVSEREMERLRRGGHRDFTHT